MTAEPKLVCVQLDIEQSRALLEITQTVDGVYDLRKQLRKNLDDIKPDGVQ